uniref:SET domain-containing protein n=1 Tax=Glossina brevipalpis TaxID=37001 RepID=A0A1A9W198_9MUSC
MIPVKESLTKKQKKPVKRNIKELRRLSQPSIIKSSAIKRRYSTKNSSKKEFTANPPDLSVHELERYDERLAKLYLGLILLAQLGPIGTHRNRSCQCSMNCPNRVIQRGRKIELCVFKTSTVRGWSLRTDKPMYKEEFVYEYVG